MKIDAQVLNRLFYNALLFSPTDSVAGGTALFAYGFGVLEALASDNYVCVWQCHFAVDDDRETYPFALSRKAMVEVEKFTRDLTGEVEIYVHGDRFAVEAADDSAIHQEVSLYDEKLWDDYQFVIQNFEQQNLDFPFAVNPERMGKICRLKGEGDFPVDFVGGKYPVPREELNWKAIGFKVGPSIRGVITPLNRDVLSPEGLWQ